MVRAIIVLVLPFYRVHPCSRTLSFAWEKVAVEQGEEFSVKIVNFEHSHVRVIDGNLVVLAEGDSVETCCEVGNAVQHLFERKVGTQHFVVERMFLLLQFLGVVEKIPRHHFEVVALNFACEFSYFVCLAVGDGQVRPCESSQQREYIVAVPGHALRGYIVRVGVVAQEVGKFQTGIYYLHDECSVVVFVAFCSQRTIGHVQFLTQVALCAEAHKRYVAGAVQGENPSLFSGLFCCHRRRLYKGCGQSVKLLFVGNVQAETIGLFQGVLLKF